MFKILLADDDRNFSEVLKTALEKDGYLVMPATDGVEAVTKFIDEGKTFDFVLLDIKMPRLDGINALRIIKKLDPDVFAITFSGHAGSGEMAESIRAGALRCLTKPFGIPQLKEDLRKYMSRRGA